MFSYDCLSEVMIKFVVLFVLICEVVSTPSSWSYTYPSLAIFHSTPPLKIQSPISRGTGSVDTSPTFLSGNYIPAAMHVLFHLSDMMKYEVRPTPSPQPGAGAGAGAGSPPTSTTVRPTQPHKPGNYAPDRPQGPQGWFSNPGNGQAWNFGWGKDFVITTSEITPSPSAPKQLQTLPADIDLLGAGPSELLHQVNTLEDTDTVGDDDVQIEKFSINYEDEVNLDFLRQKRVPPTKAYVTVLGLFDLLNKESKELGLNKFNGYSESMLKELVKTSEGSASEQLKFVLSKVIEKKNTRKDNILRKIKQMLIDLEKPDSYINMAIRYIPALQFAL